MRFIVVKDIEILLILLRIDDECLFGYLNISILFFDNGLFDRKALLNPLMIIIANLF